MAIDPVTAGIEFGKVIVDKIWPNADEDRRRNLIAIMSREKYAYDLSKGQIDNNIAEARTGNLFLAGWRPAIGWICAIALGFNFIVVPMLVWIVSVINAMAGMNIIIPEAPALVSDNIMTLVLSMLGMGAIRSYDKAKGVATKVLRVVDPAPALPAPAKAPLTNREARSRVDEYLSGSGGGEL